jgi:tetrahydromethanopterin S-methyltransferase subunit B
MKKTKTGLGLKAVGNKLTQTKGKLGGKGDKKVVAGSYEEYSKKQNSERESYDTLKYGGKGTARKFLHGFTAGVVGEKNASSLSERFGNKNEQEEAYQNLRGKSTDMGKTTPVSGVADTKTEKIVKTGTSKILGEVDSVDSKVEKIGASVQKIETSMAVAQDPDAPLSDKNDPLYKEFAAFLKKRGGKGVDIEERMKTSWGSTEEERMKNLLSGKKYERKESPTLEKLPVQPNQEPTVDKLNKDEVVPATEVAKEGLDRPRRQKSGRRSRYSYEDDTPKTYADYSKKRKKEQEAEETLRYGGKGAGRKFLYGFTAGLIGEKNASSIAEKHGNKQQQEEAYQTLKPKDRGASAGIGDQAKAEEARKEDDKKEQDAKEEKKKEELKKELDGIKETVEKSSRDGLGKIMGFIGTAIKGLMAVVGPALAALSEMLLPIIAVVGAGIAGYKIAKALGADKAGAAIASGFGKLTGQDAEANKAAHGNEISHEEMTKRQNAKLEGTGYTWAGPGKFKDKDGNIVSNDKLPKDVQEKIAGKDFQSQDAALTRKEYANSQKGTTQVQSKAKEDAVSQPSAENKQLSDSRNKNTTTVVNVPAKQQAPNVIQSNKDSGGIIIIRNTEPSVATYVASIFDHPVVHPGIYKM